MRLGATSTVQQTGAAIAAALSLRLSPVSLDARPRDQTVIVDPSNFVSE